MSFKKISFLFLIFFLALVAGGLSAEEAHSPDSLAPCGEAESAPHFNRCGLAAQAGERGIAEAQYKLGVFYRDGREVEPSYEEAFKWFKRAAKQGHKKAQYQLGLFYMSGMGVEQSDKEAVKWFKRAGEQGHKKAQYNVSGFYSDGCGADQSYKTAFEWYKKAAEQGDVDAQYKLGVFYYKGWGVDQSYEEAFKWFERAAEIDDVSAQYNLGVLYENGYSYNEAFEWYKKAAEQGDVDAQFKLGEFYYKGLGVDQSYEEAFKWFERAARRGDAEAQYNVGEFYMGPEGHAYSNKYVNDSDKLEAFYAEGPGEYNEKKAFEWYKKAAEQGHDVSQFFVGIWYKKGRGGVKQNSLLAQDWFARTRVVAAGHGLRFNTRKSKPLKKDFLCSILERSAAEIPSCP